MRFRIVVLAALAAMMAGAAWAHHNMSAMFDFNQRFTTIGTLTAIDFRNPHIYLTVEAKSDKGETQTWSFEGPPPGFFRERDVGKADFEGSLHKTVTVEASRARNGSLSGLIRELKLAGGKTVSACPQNC